MNYSPHNEKSIDRHLKFLELCDRRPHRGSPVMGNAGGSADIFRKRLLDALSWLVETSQLSIVVKNVANGRCLVGMFIPLMKSARALVTDVVIHILREASARLLVLLRWAMRRPLQAERATGTAFTHFFFYQ